MGLQLEVAYDKVGELISAVLTFSFSVATN